MSLRIALLLVLSTPLLPQEKPGEEHRPEYEKRLTRLEKAEQLDRLKLARWARYRFLEVEGQRQIALILKADPEHAAALKERKRKPRTGRAASASNRRTYAKREATIERNSIRGHHELAIWCSELGLEKEREGQLRAVLDLDADDAKARAALGFVRHEGAWYRPEAVKLLRQGLVQFEGQLWVTPDLRDGLLKGEFAYNGAMRSETEMDKIRSKWSEHWELGTTHLRVHSNLSLRKVLGIAHRLEFARRTVPKLFDLDLIPSDDRYLARVCRTPAELQALHPGQDMSASGSIYFSDSYSTREIPGVNIVRRTSSNFFEAVVDRGAGTVNVYGAQDRCQWAFTGTSNLMEFLGEKDGKIVLDTRGLKARGNHNAGALLGKDAKPAFLRVIAPGRTLGDGPEYYPNSGLALLFCGYLFDSEGGKHRKDYLAFVREVCLERGKPERMTAFSAGEVEKHHAAFVRWLASK